MGESAALCACNMYVPTHVSCTHLTYSMSLAFGVQPLQHNRHHRDGRRRRIGDLLLVPGLRRGGFLSCTAPPETGRNKALGLKQLKAQGFCAFSTSKGRSFELKAFFKRFNVHWSLAKALGGFTKCILRGSGKGPMEGSCLGHGFLSRFWKCKGLIADPR